MGQSSVPHRRATPWLTVPAPASAGPGSENTGNTCLSAQQGASWCSCEHARSAQESAGLKSTMGSAPLRLFFPHLHCHVESGMPSKKRDECRSTGSQGSPIRTSRAVGRHSCQLWHRLEAPQQKYWLPVTLPTFLFSQTLALDSDSAEELRMPECVCIANRYEHTPEVIPVKFSAIFLPELSERPTGRWVMCNRPLQKYEVDDRWPSHPRRMWPVAATRRSIADTIRMCFSAEGEQPRFSSVSRGTVSSSS